MNICKNIYISFALGLLSACSFFQEIPEKVIEGQRGAWRGLIVVDDNIKDIISTYEKDNKAAVTYHINFIFEKQIDEVRKDSSLSDEQRLFAIAELEQTRDSQISDAYTKIEAKASSMKDQASKNVLATKNLMEAVYNYMSTNPITVDNIDFWLQKLAEVNRAR